MSLGDVVSRGGHETTPGIRTPEVDSVNQQMFRVYAFLDFRSTLSYTRSGPQEGGLGVFSAFVIRRMSNLTYKKK